MHLNLSHLPARFAGLWIALADDKKKVLGSGKTMEEAARKAARKRHNLTDDEGTDDFRVIFRKSSKDTYELMDFGTHDQLYRPWKKKRR